MDEDTRQKLINDISKLQLECSRHPEEIANMFVLDECSPMRWVICGTCYSEMSEAEGKAEIEIKPLKFVFLQVHQSCSSLIADLATSAFIDHHLTLIRNLARNRFPQLQPILQLSITNYFQKYRDFLTGKYFTDFYISLAEIFALKETSNRQHSQQFNQHFNKIIQFAMNFQKLMTEYDDYSSLTLEEKLTGQGLLKQIRLQISEIYKEFREKITSNKKSENLGEDIIELFNPKIQFSKFYRFSTALSHSSVKIVDPKKAKIEQHDNEYTLMTLMEPVIGNKKASIKLKMDGIKGWMSVGIVIRKKAEQNMFKFESSSSSSHGSYQISYDGYSWSQDSSINEQYTSWYYTEGDTVTLTVNPIDGELIFVKNEQTQNPYTLKFKVEKKDKLYFCACMNYLEDCVSIAE